MKLIIVVGARPNFMKVAPILWAVRKYNDRSGSVDRTGALETLLVHTGQHYDAQMSDAFFADLGLPHPDVSLGVGSGSHAAQTAEVMVRFEEVLLRERPDAVIVVGDVNSTVACALTTAKLPVEVPGRKPLLVHVEAGLRSFDTTMPEELNRVVTDHLADILFVTERSGLENLEHEGISSKKVFFVGNTMIDSLLAFQSRADASPVLDRLGLRFADEGHAIAGTAPFGLLTLHRPANVDSRSALQEILEGLGELASRRPIIFPVHPRTRQRIHQFDLDHYFVASSESTTDTPRANTPTIGIQLVDPLGYIDFVCLMKNAEIVLTDSGGIQEETTCLGIPCVTIRENTERPITIRQGTNVLAGTTTAGIRKAIASQSKGRPGRGVPERWDGKTAGRIVEILCQHLRPETTPAAMESVEPAVSALGDRGRATSR